tara:strand:+ start:296 stop:535 length:240 start_codon:yes stop_codon:yes gene_type:complete
MKRIQKLQENLIQKQSPIFDNFNHIKMDNKISMEDNVNILIGTIHDLINVIEIRINLNEEEKNCIQDIKNNINIQDIKI